MNILYIILLTICFTVQAEDWILHNNESCAEANSIIRMTTVNSTLPTLSVCKRACSGVYTDTCSHITHMQNDTECQLSSQCTPEVSQESDYYDRNDNAADDIATEVGNTLDSSATCNIYGATGIIYVGCFGDTDLEYSATNLDPATMTVDGCLEECDRLGYTYAGLQSGNECWCGNSYGTYVETTECTSTCPGNSEQWCGASMKTSVYENSYEHGKVYLGCYADGGPRDLSGGLGRFSANSNDLCMSMCTQQGYVYSATQDVTECYCGHKYGKYGRNAESYCQRDCPGDLQQKCGGPGRNKIYANFDAESVEPNGDVMYKVTGLNSNTITKDSCVQLCWGTEGCNAVTHNNMKGECYLLSRCVLMSGRSNEQAVLVGYNSSTVEFTDRNFSTCVTVSKNTNIPVGRPWYKDYMVSTNFSVSVVGTNMTCDSTQGLQNNIFVLHKSLKHNTASDESQVYRKCTMNGSESTVNSQQRCAFTCTCEDLCDTLYVKTVGEVQPTVCEVYGQ